MTAHQDKEGDAHEEVEPAELSVCAGPAGPPAGAAPALPPGSGKTSPSAARRRPGPGGVPGGVPAMPPASLMVGPAK